MRGYSWKLPEQVLVAPLVELGLEAAAGAMSASSTSLKREVGKRAGGCKDLLGPGLEVGRQGDLWPDCCHLGACS